MSFAPDFGLRLVHDGASPEMDVLLVPFEIDRISAVNEELFTTISNIVFDGEPHAVSLDFDVDILEAISQLCPKKIARLIKDELLDSYTKGHTLMFPKPIEVSITARLGHVQTVQYEEFIPLVVQSVSKLGRHPERSKK